MKNIKNNIDKLFVILYNVHVAVSAATHVGAWRSLVARLFRVQEAVSSNLAAPTT